MGDLNQARYNEAQKLADKRAKAALEFPSPEKTFADLLAGTGIPVQAATLLALKFQQLSDRVAALETAARNSGAPHQRNVEKRNA